MSKPLATMKEGLADAARRPFKAGMVDVRGLSTRTLNVLACYLLRNSDTTLEQLKQQIHDGEVDVLKWRDCGQVTKRELFAWAGVAECCPTCGRPLPTEP